jgi:2-isopropylmalate synthase
VILYDCTLRDGMQGEGMSLSAEEKLRVAHVLDGLGIHLIEAGFPASNPKEEAFFALLAQETFPTAQIAAFGMTRRRDVAAEDDPALRLLADTFAPVTTIVGKSWGLHLEKVVKVDREENLRMIADSVAFLAAQGKRVVYDAEHFFDGYADDPAYALQCARAAAEAGAEWVTLCDTNGGRMPHEIAAATRHVLDELGLIVGIHCHDDAGCGVANSLAAVREGAGMVQGTMNGYGERCGNANLVTIVPNLQLKLGLECVPTLQGWTEASHLLDEMLNFPPEPNRPYVGANAFAHKGGLHVAGVNADPATFEHVDPTVVGNTRDILISELSGKGTVLSRAGAQGVSLDDSAAARVAERVKQLEHQGYHFEAADGSFDLLIRRETGDYEPLFRLESWRVIAEKHEDGEVSTEATIKIWVDGQRFIRTAEGNGPVHALDRALREAIGERYPHLRDIRLVNYKVRILEEWKATGATTRVLLDATDGHDTWGAIGVHENVIEASWDALVDSLEAGMIPRRAPTTA